MVYLYLVLQQTIGSMTHIVAQDASQHVPPLELLLLRSVGASVVFAIFLFITQKRWNIFHRIARGDLGRFFLLGMLNVPLNQLLYLNGIKYTSPANSALLYAMTPAIVFILTSIIHSERPSWKKAAGIAVAFCGAALVMFEEGVELRAEHTLGNILIFIAVIAWSLFTMLGRPVVLKYGAVYVTATNMILGTIIYLPFGLLSSSVSSIAAISSVSWTEVAYLALIASVANYVLWYLALAKLEATRVAIFQNLQPLITTVLALYLGRTILTGQFVGGGVLALAGVLIVELF
ncbi:MAG TPA: EamA family transporter [Candidatus Kapabacteria bacterium]|jgi:drug/metabolite transporter (DMT)-like permease